MVAWNSVKQKQGLERFREAIVTRFRVVLCECLLMNWEWLWSRVVSIVFLIEVWNWRVGKTPRPQSLDKRELALQRRPTGETAFTSNLEVLMAQASQGKAR